MCPECHEEMEGGAWGDDAWCPACELRFETDFDYTGVPDNLSVMSWTEGEGKPCTREEWGQDES